MSLKEIGDFVGMIGLPGAICLILILQVNRTLAELTRQVGRLASAQRTIAEALKIEANAEDSGHPDLPARRSRHAE